MTTADDDVASLLPHMTRWDKLTLKRTLAEMCAKAEIPLNDTTSPGTLATRLDPQTQVQVPHLQVIDEALTHMLAEPNARVMIFCPTQVGKSVRVAQWFPFWWLSIRPRDRILMAAAESRLALRNAAIVRELIREHGAEFGLNLVGDEGSKSDWSIRAGGSMRSRGLRGNFIGQPMDLGIIDDPFTGRPQAESLKIRDFVWDWYSSVWSSRKSPTYREVIVTTRWHADDLAGRLLAQDGRVEEGGAWHVVHLPAIALAPNPAKGIYADPLGREPGEPLTHPLILPDQPETWNGAATHHDALVQWWATKRGMSTIRDWNAMSQGVPTSAEGALLTEAQVREQTRPAPAEFRRKVVGVDPSGGGRDSAGIVLVGLDEQQHAWFLADRTAVMSSIEWPRQACLLAHEHGADRIVVESNFGGDQATTLVAQAWELLQRDVDPETGHPFIPSTELCPRVVAVTARKSKVLRAEPIAQAVTTHRVWFDALADTKQLQTEFTMWEPGSTWSPGALDAGVYAATEVLPPVPTGASTSKPAARRGQGRTSSGIFGERRRSA